MRWGMECTSQRWRVKGVKLYSEEGICKELGDVIASIDYGAGLILGSPRSRDVNR